MYEANTSMVFDEFSSPVEKDNDRHNREMRISNRLEELNSIAFALDVVKALPEEARGHFVFPDEPGADFDEQRFMASRVHDNMLAYRLNASNILRITAEMPSRLLAREVPNTAVAVFQDRLAEIRGIGTSQVRGFVEEQLLLSGQADGSDRRTIVVRVACIADEELTDEEKAMVAAIPNVKKFRKKAK